VVDKKHQGKYTAEELVLEMAFISMKIYRISF